MKLEGPLQSWGTQGRFDIRDTETEPSKSGVLGMVGAALGMEREDDAMLAQLNTLALAVRVDREGTILRDYHTVRIGRNAERGRSADETAPTTRYYLADASFTVALGGEDDALVERIGAALCNPKWVLFLGRKACVPSRPPFMAIADASPEDAVRSAPFDGVRPAGNRVRLVVESPPGDAAQARNDVALSFKRYGRQHARRFVRIEWLDRVAESPTAGAAADGGAT